MNRYEYDPRNRRTAVINGAGYLTESVYDLAGRKVERIDGNGHETTFACDALGRLTTMIDPLGFVTRTTYDANGTAGLQLTNSDGGTVSREYDELNRLTRERDVTDRPTSFRYDLLGNRTRVTDDKGRTNFTYDNLGRLVTIADPLIESPKDNVTRFTYHQAGNVLVDPYESQGKGDVHLFCFPVGIQRIHGVHAHFSINKEMRILLTPCFQGLA